MRKQTYNIAQDGPRGLKKLARTITTQIMADWDETTEVESGVMLNTVLSYIRITGVPDPSYGARVIRETMKKTVKDAGFGYFPLNPDDEGYSIGRGKSWVIIQEVNGSIPPEQAARIKLLYTNRSDCHERSAVRHHARAELDASVARRASRVRVPVAA